MNIVFWNFSNNRTISVFWTVVLGQVGKKGVHSKISNISIGSALKIKRKYDQSGTAYQLSGWTLALHLTGRCWITGIGLIDELKKFDGSWAGIFNLSKTVFTHTRCQINSSKHQLEEMNFS